MIFKLTFESWNSGCIKPVVGSMGRPWSSIWSGVPRILSSSISSSSMKILISAALAPRSSMMSKSGEDPSRGAAKTKIGKMIVKTKMGKIIAKLKTTSFWFPVIFCFVRLLRRYWKNWTRTDPDKQINDSTLSLIIQMLAHILHTVRNLHFLSKYSTLISRENCRFFFGWKTRENVVVLDFLAVDNFDFTRKIAKKILMKNSWKCWVFE